MTTAREQAREAAVVRGGGATFNQMRQESADRASDIWEPILQEALEALECSEPHYPQAEHDATTKKIREALHGSSS